MFHLFPEIRKDLHISKLDLQTLMSAHGPIPGFPFHHMSVWLTTAVAGLAVKRCDRDLPHLFAYIAS